MHGIAYFINIPGTDTFLHVGKTGSLRMFSPQQVGHQGMHPGSGEKYGGIVIGDQRGTFNNSVTFGMKKINIFLTEFSGKHDVFTFPFAC